MTSLSYGLWKSSTSLPIPRRGLFAAVLLGVTGVLIGLWLAGWIAFRERNPILASDAGSWIPAAVLAGLAFLAAARVSTGPVVVHGDRLDVYGGLLPSHVPVSQVTGFSMRVARRFGIWTQIVALDRTGFDRRICQIPGEPDRCPGLTELLGTLNTWCGFDESAVRTDGEEESAARMEEAAHRLANADKAKRTRPISPPS